MANPQVTITLGRSGQKVVKDSWRDSDGIRAGASATSGSKRSMAESLGSSADHAFSNVNKRMRDDMIGRSHGYSNRLDGVDSGLGPQDLRLELTRRRISREMEIQNAERRKVELCEKVSNAIRSLEPPNDKLFNKMPSSREVVETQKMGPTRSPYASWPSNGVGRISPERIPRSSSGVSTPMSGIHELPQLSLVRPSDGSRTERVLTRNPSDSSRPMPPLPTAPRHPLDAGKLVSEFPTPSGGMSMPPFQSSHVPKESQPLTVSSLLHSLGLGKYYINFQAEEIDMAALKQMGEGDLKELGIPMGPRKKILTALQARTRRPVTQAPSNFLHHC